MDNFTKSSTQKAPCAMGMPNRMLAAFSPLKREPAYKAVASVMEQYIISGELRPGTALPPEQELAAQFGVNRSTIREAIRQLEQEGLLVRQSGRHLYAVLPGIHDLAPRAVRALILHHVTFQELWEVAVVVEPLAASIAALNADEDDLREMEENLRAEAGALTQSSTIEDMRRHSERDVAFHSIIARASKNRALMLAREPFSLLYSPALTLLQGELPQAAARNLRAHEHAVGAIKARNAAQAHEWTRKHLEDFRRGFLLAKLPMDAPVDSLPVATPTMPN
jgi:DNA-binding FadR family transcriptional regulator